MLLTAMMLAVLSGRSQRRALIIVGTQAVGRDLIACTNSARLIRLGPDLQARLSSLFETPTHVAKVFLGDEPAPFGDGRACSRLVFTNASGQGLLIRLRQGDSPSNFNVLDFRNVSQ